MASDLKKEIIEKIKEFNIHVITGSYIRVSGDTEFYFQEEYLDEQLESMDYYFLELTLKSLRNEYIGEV